MKYHLDRYASGIGFCVLVGADDVRIEGGWVVGREKPDPDIVRHPARGRTVAESFMNRSSKLGAVTRFTSRYGPLFGFWRNEEKDREKLRCLRFPVSSWHEAQIKATEIWDSRTVPREDQIREFVGGDGDVIYIGGEVVFCCPCIFSFVVLEILAIPPERRWKCARPECGTRYVRDDLKNKYCGPACTKWAEKQSKLAYWNRNKEEYLAERKSNRARTRNRRKDGTRKTR
jgi:hypothetical protein